ncbi:hypothetical protein [Sphingobacterium sp. LRF_L2]|uniref:hypothetical protein n=1 Tax=Sphingobacterium sp. LRF_L2 TaxID=3369421 RepID=UPI003F5EEC43
MEKILRKLALLDDIWRNRFWDSDYLLKQLRYDKKLSANYPGVVLGYLNDTLPLIANFSNVHSGYGRASFLPSIGLLQIIYMQQDLIDELLQTFHIQKATLSDKYPNRIVRNELAGHPIRRLRSKIDGKEYMESYSLFSYEASSEKIEYLRYERKNDFKFDLQTHKVSDIIDRHFKFLNKYILLILQKSITILKKFNRKCNELLLLGEKSQFVKLIDQTKIYFNNFFNEDYTFEPIFIKLCWSRRADHIRYQYACDKFKNSLKENLTLVIKRIDELKFTVQNIDLKLDQEPNNNLKLEVKIVTKEIPQEVNELHLDDSVNFGQGTQPTIDHYELSKLYTNHPIFGIAYFQKLFNSHSEILVELEQMKIHVGGLEFYCSYNYLIDVLLKQYITN